jgi:hypothetical protein
MWFKYVLSSLLVVFVFGIICPDGQVMREIGSGSCVKCKGGMIPSADQYSCETCPPGKRRKYVIKYVVFLYL